MKNLFAACALATLSQAATGQIVGFDNADGTFVWTPGIEFSDGTVSLQQRGLDVTLSAADNAAGLGLAEREITCTYFFPLTSSEVNLDTAGGRGLDRAQIALGGTAPGSDGSARFAQTFEPGDSIGPAEDFGNRGVTARHPIGGPEPLIGLDAIVGIRIPTDSTATSFFYGYVELEWRDMLIVDGVFGPVNISVYQPVAWAYETTPDTPIAVPAAGCDNPADVNGDGELTPADFNAWVVAFNTQAPECDQNGDGFCGPADFNPWVQNYNFGC
ncbi:MAG: hypothetical protein AAFS11_02220 [Planctomycetota bacterium]